jgi:Undecaprenyl-phosphate glucose phosphotransferase
MTDVQFSMGRTLAPERAKHPAGPDPRGVLRAAGREQQAVAFRSRLGFSLMAMALDFIIILAAMVLSDLGYNLMVHNWGELCAANLQLGLFASVVFVGSNALRHGYTISDYMDLSGHAQRVFSRWNISFLSAATFGFLARAIEESSRGTFIVFFFVGLCGLYSGRAALVRLVKRHASEGGVLSSRIFVIGFQADIDTFMRQNQPARQGLNVVATPVLAEGAIEANLAEATEAARLLMPDDIFIVVPWQKSDVLDKCIMAFMKVPAAVHLYVYPNSALRRFASTPVGANGSISSFRLNGDAMGMFGSGFKRASDIVLSFLAILLLMPLFIAVGIAIKLDSRGPVLFNQTRSGFNKRPFRIWKFRSMSTSEDGSAVRQATFNDARITRVGRFLRRFNIDELPQLFNVLKGDMSLVGPRPHALVHDREFETGIALYARRHNVKPGITGWAQVNGLRGETNTPDKISQRVHYDLYYIDNWSFVFDIWILFLTVFSRRAYRNAG